MPPAPQRRDIAGVSPATGRPIHGGSPNVAALRQQQDGRLKPLGPALVSAELPTTLTTATTASGIRMAMKVRARSRRISHSDHIGMSA